MFRSIGAGIAALSVLLLSASAGDTVRYVPSGLRDTPWLQRLGAAQMRAAATLAAFHGFHFTDRVADSGITFKYRIVDDAGKAYKAAHYDHGTGIVIADVDGDGRSDVYFVSQAG